MSEKIEMPLRVGNNRVLSHIEVKRSNTWSFTYTHTYKLNSVLYTVERDKHDDALTIRLNSIAINRQGNPLQNPTLTTATTTTSTWISYLVLDPIYSLCVLLLKHSQSPQRLNFLLHHPLQQHRHHHRQQQHQQTLMTWQCKRMSKEAEHHHSAKHRTQASQSSHIKSHMIRKSSTFWNFSPYTTNTYFIAILCLQLQSLL